jgi:hypothetical protein
MCETTPVADPTLNSNGGAVSIPPVDEKETFVAGPVLGYNIVAPTEAAVVFCALLAHEVNRVYCDSLGDHSQVPWAEAPEWQRSSVINGVRFVLENPLATPAELHENWRQQKEAEGWTLGLVKDALAKTHPCMMPYELLPPSHQTKDKLVQVIVRAFFGL